jgi:hypothetical protein
VGTKPFDVLYLLVFLFEVSTKPYKQPISGVHKVYISERSRRKLGVMMESGDTS